MRAWAGRLPAAAVAEAGLCPVAAEACEAAKQDDAADGELAPRRANERTFTAAISVRI